MYACNSAVSATVSRATANASRSRKVINLDAFRRVHLRLQIPTVCCSSIRHRTLLVRRQARLRVTLVSAFTSIFGVHTCLFSRSPVHCFYLYLNTHYDGYARSARNTRSRSIAFEFQRRLSASQPRGRKNERDSACFPRRERSAPSSSSRYSEDASLIHALFRRLRQREKKTIDDIRERERKRQQN